jgi:hypothetical protein
VEDLIGRAVEHAQSVVRDEQRLIGWQSGLETWNGTRKPAYAAFQRAALRNP